MNASRKVIKKKKQRRYQSAQLPPPKFEGLMKQYFILKNPYEFANNVLNQEFVDEVAIEHWPELRKRARLLALGKEYNIPHFPQNRTGQSKFIGPHDKYFLVDANKEGLRLRIAQWILAPKEGWEDLFAISIPKEELMGKAIMRKEKIVGTDNYFVSLSISCYGMDVFFIMKEDIFERYRACGEIEPIR